MGLIAVLVFAAVGTFAVCFQFALALGAPFGEMAMGGRYPGRFPARMRVAAIVQGLIIAGLVASVMLISSLIVALG